MSALGRFLRYHLGYRNDEGQFARAFPLYCSLCFVVSRDLAMPMIEGSDEAVTIIDGNASCHDHLEVLQGRTVTQAYETLRARLAGELS